MMIADKAVKITFKHRGHLKSKSCCWGLGTVGASSEASALYMASPLIQKSRQIFNFFESILSTCSCNPLEQLKNWFSLGQCIIIIYKHIGI